MAGRWANPGDPYPSFWLFHVNNPTYRRTNFLFVLGGPGVPQAALYNPYADGQYTALFTDQVGDVVPIVVRNFEEGRVWVRTDEWAQAGAGTWGGIAFNLDNLHAYVGYEYTRMELFYTRPSLGPIQCFHVGPTYEKERLPGGPGWQDDRFGLEVGGYIGGMRSCKFYKAGRVYVGIRGISDFDDYDAISFDVRINL
jgi:hypothetical protein